MRFILLSEDMHIFMHKKTAAEFNPQLSNNNLSYIILIPSSIKSKYSILSTKASQEA